MSNYFYAYHGPANKIEFDYSLGYGTSQKYKQGKVNIGDFVFIIQKRKKNVNYELCGLFKITDCYYDVDSSLPYRMKLADFSKLPKFIPLEHDALDSKLPQIVGDHRLSNFQNHFCRQGLSFQNVLSQDVVNILNLVIDDHSPSIDEIEIDFNDKVKASLELSQSDREKRLKNSPSKAEKIIVKTAVYKRNPDVVAQVLIRANGRCELCENEAPFIRRKDKTPFLEVHHKVFLCNGGDDTVNNAIAICPNCHREQHFG
ncbi:HNH endonuclease [Psychromonas sp. psych-6C06]|uniref:HNH endonuclease n=1 Tax=Psychromonas sp. psych-6C06 TaxID=2058089 RepID=UPI000C34B145|nr:HNH endonuclease [Psychromonas sp. psych-6C06]PKF60178.1 HNH endonuclease [Psychromonas sp. psych-6C06]